MRQTAFHPRPGRPLITPRRRLIAGLAGLPAACAAGAEAQLELPAPRRGGLAPLGGLVLDTRAWGFGGFSALHLDADGLVSAVSDRGRWWQARLLRDAEGRPTGFGPARHGPLRDPAGAPLRGRQGDAEALARLADGSWLIGFERAHRLQRHATLDAPGMPFPTPPGLDEAPPNAGIEGVARLADGRLLLLTEGLPGPEPDSRAAWIGATDGARWAWTRRTYRPQGGLEPTDVAALPDGGALVLERDHTLLGGFRARLARIAPPVLRGAEPIRAATLLDLPGDGPAENWEGVAVRPAPEGLLVALVSDDNERPAQRTLFLLYRLG